MQDQNEIRFLLDFDFRNAGAKEAEDWITRFIAYFEQFKDVVGSSAPILARYEQQQTELITTTKKLAEAIQSKGIIDKEALVAAQLSFEHAIRLKKGLDDTVSSMKSVTKTTEEMSGELGKATSMVKTLSGKLMDMELQGKANSKQYIDTANQLKIWKDALIAVRIEVDGVKASQEELGGIITQTKERIKELNLTLDTFQTEEELASVAAKAYKDELAQLNEMLKLLQNETSGVLTLEHSLNEVRGVNIKMQNKIIALEEVDIRLKAELSAANKDLANEVKILNAEQELDLKIQQAENALAPELIAKESKLIALKKERTARLKELTAAETGAGNAAVETGVKTEEAGNKSIWTLDNVRKKIDFMGVRMLATLFWWGLVIGAATELWDIWTKIDEVQQRAADRLKTYFDSFQNNQKALEDATPKTQADVMFDEDKGNRLVANMKRYLDKGDDKKAFVQYKELLQLFPKIFDAMNELEFIEKARGDRMQKQISSMSEYNKLLKERATSEELYRSSLLDVTRNQQNQEKTKEKILQIIKTSSDDEVKRMSFPIDESDEDVIKMLQSRFTGYRKETNLIANNNLSDIESLKQYSEILNRLQSEQNINKTNAQDRKEFLDRVAPRIADMEGNAKDPKESHKKSHNLEEERATEKSRNQGKVLDINTLYDESPRSDIDKSDRVIALLDQAQNHQAAMEAINKKYENSKEVSDEKMKKLRIDDVNDLKHTNDEIIKEGKRQLMESQRYNEERFKQIKEANDKMMQIAESSRRALEKAEEKQIQENRKQKNASRFNAIQAFFGGGGGSKAQELKDEHLNLDENERDAKENARISLNKFNAAKLYQGSTQDKVNEDDSIANPGELQKESAHKNKEANIKALEDVKQAQALYNTDAANAEKAINDKKLKLLTERQQNEVKIAEATFNATTKVANAAFDAQQRKIKQQMADTEAMYRFEVTLAGNNSAAKIRLAIAEHGHMLALKREEAKSQKAQSIFNATTNAAVAVTSALTTPPAPLGIALALIVGAAALFQISKIASAPLPSYFKGRKKGPKELANVGEEGFELGEKNGKFRLLGKGVAELEEDEIVHTHEHSKRFLNDMLKGTGAYIRNDKERINIISQSISKKDYKDAMVEALKESPAPVIHLPAPGVQDRLVRTQLRNGAF